MAVYRSLSHCSRRSRFLSRFRHRLALFDRLAIRNIHLEKPAPAPATKTHKEEEMAALHKMAVPVGHTTAPSAERYDPLVPLKNTHRYRADTGDQLSGIGTTFTIQSTLPSEPPNFSVSPTLTWPHRQTPSHIDCHQSLSAEPHRRKSFTVAEAEHVKVWLDTISTEDKSQTQQQERAQQQQPTKSYTITNHKVKYKEQQQQQQQQQHKQINNPIYHEETNNNYIHLDILPTLMQEIRKRQKSDSTTCPTLTYHSDEWEDISISPPPPPSSSSPVTSTAGSLPKQSDFPTLFADAHMTTAETAIESLQHLLVGKVLSGKDKENDREEEEKEEGSEEQQEQQEEEEDNSSNNRNHNHSRSHSDKIYESLDAHTQTHTDTHGESGTEADVELETGGNEDEHLLNYCDSNSDEDSDDNTATYPTLVCCTLEDIYSHLHCYQNVHGQHEDFTKVWKGTYNEDDDDDDGYTADDDNDGDDDEKTFSEISSTSASSSLATIHELDTPATSPTTPSFTIQLDSDSTNVDKPVISHGETNENVSGVDALLFLGHVVGFILDVAAIVLIFLFLLFILAYMYDNSTGSVDSLI